MSECESDKRLLFEDRITHTDHECTVLDLLYHMIGESEKRPMNLAARIMLHNFSSYEYEKFAYNISAQLFPEHLKTDRDEFNHVRNEHIVDRFIRYYNSLKYDLRGLN
jgi:hypothetical protein